MKFARLNYSRIIKLIHLVPFVMWNKILDLIFWQNSNYMGKYNGVSTVLHNDLQGLIL